MDAYLEQYIETWIEKEPFKKRLESFFASFSIYDASGNKYINPIRGLGRKTIEKKDDKHLVAKRKIKITYTKGFMPFDTPQSEIEISQEENAPYKYHRGLKVG